MKKKHQANVHRYAALCKMVLCIQTRKEFRWKQSLLSEPCVLQIVPVLSNEIAISWEMYWGNKLRKRCSAVCMLLGLSKGREFVNSSWFSGGGEEGGKVEGDIRKEEEEQKRFLPDSLAWHRVSLSSKECSHFLEIDWKNAGQVSFKVSLGYYLTSRMLGLILAQMSGKVTGLEIRRPGSLVLIWLPTSFNSVTLERSLTLFCPKLFYLYNRSWVIKYTLQF